MTPPLRFLLAVVGGWACARAAVLAPWPRQHEPPRIAAVPAQQRHSPAPGLVPAPAAAQAEPREYVIGAPAARSPNAHLLASPLRRAALKFRGEHGTTLALTPVQGAVTALVQLPAHTPVQTELEVGGIPSPFGGVPNQRPLAMPRTAGRWSFSAWALARPGGSPGLPENGAPPLASAGTLGASQAGARLTYRVAGPPTEGVSLTARLTSPARSLSGTEAALGVEWQPSRRLPLRIAAERRQAVGSDGRSAFALLAHGGLGDLPVAAGFRLDAYGQAGIVGARARDLFADGAARLTRPLDRKKRLAVGAGAWAAAQPGVSRVDVGPTATLRLPGASLSLDWRARVSGNARPASGPALTLSTGF